MRFIFVGGCGRSGTTLVQKLLVSHSRIAGGPEFDHTSAILDLWQVMGNPGHLERQKAFYDAQLLDRSFRTFYEGFFERVLEGKPEAVYVSEKTPQNIFVADRLLRLFPDSVFVNVVRDGRDVFVSFHEVQKRRRNAEPNLDIDNFTPASVANLWNAAVDSYFNLVEDPQLRSRVYNLRFESLVQQPEEVLKGLFDFLELDFEPDLLHPERITEGSTGAVVDGYFYTKDMYRQPFNPERIGRWKRELGRLTERRFRRAIKHNLKRLEYPLS